MRSRVLRLSEEEYEALSEAHGFFWGEAAKHVPMGETVKKLTEAFFQRKPRRGDD